MALELSDLKSSIQSVVSPLMLFKIPLPLARFTFVLQLPSNVLKNNIPYKVASLVLKCRAIKNGVRVL